MVRAVLLALVAWGLHAPAMATVAEGVAKWRAQDWAGAVAEWITPAARGDADALFNLGQAYKLGRGVPQSMATAQDYYRRAAEKGHLAATANLGITLYQDGRKGEALTWLRTAADKGDTRAAYVLGVASFNGDGAPRNGVLGYAYMLLAQQGGLTQADGQAARMAVMLSPAERARGEAAAAALAAGEPVPVELLAGGRAMPVPREVAATAPASEDQAESAEAKPAAEAAKPAPRPGRTEEARGTTDMLGWRVQLGAYNSELVARNAWATLVAQQAEALEGAKPVYLKRGGLVRLQIGPFEERGPARELCARLAAAGRPCFVTDK
ncbi:SPOR domain-containing protein [Sandaracinobacteroides saxicola]|uniref:SPOR domain-containing protein n=1 Tax=Sandaracinobacteroides saxicola TaxID=2759707 RepID=A0A7G5IEV1_9SPHN|nr:SPOR domain-containing protein [Sandaracinobacteroides saxicola]QMW21893.1 SPOR domain-containing protein [Sandaracinobacteroides saxicola]